MVGVVVVAYKHCSGEVYSATSLAVHEVGEVQVAGREAVLVAVVVDLAVVLAEEETSVAAAPAAVGNWPPQRSCAGDENCRI